MIECSLLPKRRPWVDKVFHGVVNIVLSLLPYAFWLLGVNLRFALILVLIELIINFYHGLTLPADEVTEIASLLVEEGREQTSAGERVALVTGATSGIGKEIALALANAGYRLILPARQVERGMVVAEELKRISGNDKIHVFECDLMEPGSIFKFVTKGLDEFNTPKIDRLHLLINNAGIYEGSFKVNSEGVESQWATNYFAPFLLTRLLIHRLKKGASLDKDARIINVGSAAAYNLRSLDFHSCYDAEHFSYLGNYCQTKYALLLFTHELARKAAGCGITVTAMEPGMVRSAITRSSSLATIFAHGILTHIAPPSLFPHPLHGALTALWLAMARETRDLPGGTFYAHLRQSPLGLAIQRDIARGEAIRLWSRSETIIRMTYSTVLQLP